MYHLKHCVLSVVAVCALLVAGCDAQPAAGTDARATAPPTKVVTVQLQKQALRDSIEALGTARANEAVEITPRVASFVTRIAFEEGQLVARGDLLVELENSEIHAELAVARATLSESRRLYERSRSLIDSQAISASNLEQLQAAMQVNEAQVGAVAARLENTMLRAPFRGHIGLRRVSPGGFVDTSTVITTLDDTETIKLDFTIPEIFLSVVAEGMPIVAHSLVYPQQLFDGTVSSVDTRLDPIARSVQVRATLPNPQALLKPGMFMTVDLQRDRGALLVAPEESIVPEGGQQYVYQIIDDIAVLQPVTLGRRVPGLVEVVSGVAAGDVVITEGTHKVRDGARVQVIERQAAGGSLQSLTDNP